jgi:type VI secretion system protein ImpK
MGANVDFPEVSKSESAQATDGRKLDRLALLYEGILTVIGRVHTGRQEVQNPADFRLRMKKALNEISSTAARRGYATADVQEGNFAVVAFLDEAMLTAPDHSVNDWVGETLAEELYGERSAGEIFFKKLESLRAQRDSQDLAELLEVYYLCLLLGFEGKFAGSSKAELNQLVTNLRDRIGRMIGYDAEFSPDAAVSAEPPRPAIAADPLIKQIRLFALAAFLFALLCLVGFSIQLHLQASDLHDAVQQRLGPGDQP